MEDMQVAAANAGGLYGEENILLANLRNGYFPEFDGVRILGEIDKSDHGTATLRNRLRKSSKKRFFQAK